MTTVVTLATATVASAQQEALLHNFGKSGAGAFPYSGLVRDSAGNFYGATVGGGTYSQGTVYELTLQATGGWKERVLHSFSNNGIDGYEPYGGLTIDAFGNLFGAARLGGPYDDGMIYELTPNGDGSWTEKVVHTFNFVDGAVPYSSLIFDPSGNLYGTAYEGGSRGEGTVFELTFTNGQWAEKVLHNFGISPDGSNPYGNLIFDSAGNLYGTTSYGGTGTNCTFGGCGVVFEMKPTPGGNWVESVLHTFNNDGADGFYPTAGLTIDSSGNLYGTTSYGGSGTNCGHGCGTAFELRPAPNGTWSETILHSFADTTIDGGVVTGGLVMDHGGKLYGTTSVGGPSNYGIVFELTQSAGTWSETILNDFNGTNGNGPNAAVTLDSFGNLYGTTVNGGSEGGGVVFEVKP